MSGLKLLNPNAGPTNGLGNQTVAGLARFRNKNEFGDMVESYKPLENIKVETKFYKSSLETMAMHRWDGLKIPFLFHTCETDNLHTQQYLDDEINNGNQFISHATEEDVLQFKMRINPKGAIEEQLRPQVEQQVKSDLAAKLGIDAAALDELIATAGVTNDASKLAGSTGADLTPMEKLKLSMAQKATGTGTGAVVTDPKPFQASIVGSDKTVNSADSNGN